MYFVFVRFHQAPQQRTGFNNIRGNQQLHYGQQFLSSQPFYHTNALGNFASHPLLTNFNNPANYNYNNINQFNHTRSSYSNNYKSYTNNTNNMPYRKKPQMPSNSNQYKTLVNRSETPKELENQNIHNSDFNEKEEIDNERLNQISPSRVNGEQVSNATNYRPEQSSDSDSFDYTKSGVSPNDSKNGSPKSTQHNEYGNGELATACNREMKDITQCSVESPNNLSDKLNELQISVSNNSYESSNREQPMENGHVANGNGPDVNDEEYEKECADALPNLPDNDPIFMIGVPRNVSKVGNKILPSIIPDTIQRDREFHIFMSEVNFTFILNYVYSTYLFKY